MIAPASFPTATRRSLSPLCSSSVLHSETSIAAFPLYHVVHVRPDTAKRTYPMVMFRGLTTRALQHRRKRRLASMVTASAAAGSHFSGLLRNDDHHCQASATFACVPFGGRK